MTGALSRRILSMAPLIWATAIVVVSVMPGRSLPDLTGKDLAAHAVAYAVLACLAFAQRRLVAGRAPKPAWRLAILGPALLGAALEGVQHFIAGRFASLDDAIANTIGALTGATLAALALRAREAPAGS